MNVRLKNATTYGLRNVSDHLVFCRSGLLCRASRGVLLIGSGSTVG
ncbi:MAG: hypothetical protein ACI30I_10675 [Parabacteroides sp.]